MSTPTSVKRHPIHPMIVPIPIGLWIFSLVCDVIYDFGLGGSLWKSMAYYALIGGIIGAVAAVLPGFVDYRSLTNSRKSSIARLHMLLNPSLVLLYSLNAWLRYVSSVDSLVPPLLSWVGMAILGASGWLGWELVYVHGVAVESEDREEQTPKRQPRAA